MKFFDYFRKEKRNAVHQSESTELTYEQALQFQKYTTLKALKLSAVYAAMSIISNSIALLPIYVKQRKDNQKSIVNNSPIAKLFYSMLQSKHNAIKQLVWDLLLVGNSFLYIKRDAQGKPEELIYLDPHDVVVNYDKQNDRLDYTVSNHKQIPKLVKKENIIHFAKDTKDGINGRGFLFFATDVIDLAGFTQQAAEDYFGSGCNVTGILQFKGRVTPEQMKKIRQQWTQIHGNGMSGLGILEGDAEYTPISQNSAEAQMLETREFNVSEIARFFNISPILLGDLSHNSYSSIEDSNIEFVSHCLLPIINLMEEELNRKLIVNKNQYIDFDENELLKSNKSTMAQYYVDLVSNAILTINEAREQLDYNPVSGGDDLIIPYTKIEDNTIGGIGNDSEDVNKDKEEKVEEDIKE